MSCVLDGRLARIPHLLKEGTNLKAKLDFLRIPHGCRFVKLDVKGFSRAQDRFTKIGAGDINWADVRQALVDIDYTGWVAAEVGGGGPDRLAEVSANMDRAFGLG